VDPDIPYSGSGRRAVRGRLGPVMGRSSVAYGFQVRVKGTCTGGATIDKCEIKQEISSLKILYDSALGWWGAWKNAEHPEEGDIPGTSEEVARQAEQMRNDWLGNRETFAADFTREHFYGKNKVGHSRAQGCELQWYDAPGMTNIVSEHQSELRAFEMYITVRVTCESTISRKEGPDISAVFSLWVIAKAAPDETGYVNKWHLHDVATTPELPHTWEFKAE